MISYLSSFTFFAILACITPGPTNIISLSIGMRTNAHRSLPFVIGAGFMASLILFLTFFGVAQFLDHYPMVRGVMTITGALWISWMAWQLFRLEKTDVQSLEKIPGLTQGCALQVINPKVWMMALSVSSLFFMTDFEKLTNALTLSVIFFVIAVPSMALWAYMGVLLKRQTQTKFSEGFVYKTLSLLLLATVCSLLYSQFA